MEKMGLRADAVANGHEVLDSIRSIPYDLILMDCQMPEMDGLEATRIIRSSESLELRNIPIVAMTANAIMGDRERCIESGMNDYISKPIAPAALFQVLKKWLVSSTQTLESFPLVSFSQETLTLDMDVIASLHELDESDDGKFVMELVRIYLESVPSSFAKMKSAFDESDFALISREAHQLNSSSANLGLMKMALLSLHLEAATKVADKSQVGLLLNDYEGVFRDAEATLQKVLS